MIAMAAMNFRRHILCRHHVTFIVAGASPDPSIVQNVDPNTLQANMAESKKSFVDVAEVNASRKHVIDSLELAQRTRSKKLCRPIDLFLFGVLKCLTFDITEFIDDKVTFKLDNAC